MREWDKGRISKAINSTDHTLMFNEKTPSLIVQRYSAASGMRVLGGI
jgi:hypothetical protein